MAPHNRFVRDLIAEGYVGNLRSVRIHVSMNYFQPTVPQAPVWTIPAENFSHVIAIYAGHFLDMLFHAVGRPTEVSALLANQFKELTVRETGAVHANATPHQLVAIGRLGEDAALSIHIEGGKRNGSGVQIDITGDAGDLRITNRSAFGDVGDDYAIEGAHGDKLMLEPLVVPPAYDWLPASDLPSAVLELANLYAAFARFPVGVDGAPTFADGLWMHRLLDQVERSSADGLRLGVDEVAPAGGIITAPEPVIVDDG